MTWAIYLPYRIAHLHFIVIANMAISGYLAGFMVLSLKIPFALALLTGFAVGGLIGYVVSLFIGDAPTFAVVIVGFTFIYISRTVVENIPAIGGSMGMFGLPLIAKTPSMHRWAILALLYIMVLLAGIIIHRFDNSRLGRSASAIFVDRDLATSLGIDIKKMGQLLQVFSCVIAGGTGVLYGFIYRSFHLDFFTFHLVGIFMTTIFVGGYSTMWGPLIMAPVLYGFPLLFPKEIQSWRMVIYGVILILILALKPEGFVTRKFVHNLSMRLSQSPRRNKGGS